MLKDVKTSHRGREEQLSQAAQSYKTRLETVVRRHEELLCAYRDIRAQVEALGLNELDLGPDEHELIISDASLQSSQQKEIVRLQTELHRLRISNKQVKSSRCLYFIRVYCFYLDAVNSIHSRKLQYNELKLLKDFLMLQIFAW